MKQESNLVLYKRLFSIRMICLRNYTLETQTCLNYAWISFKAANVKFLGHLNRLRS